MRKIQSFPHPHNFRADIEGSPFSDVSLKRFASSMEESILRYNLSAKFQSFP